MNIDYLYVNPEDPPREYLEMLRRWYGEGKWNRFKKNQFEWYQQYPRYKIYAAKVEGKFVGQAAAFGVDFYNNNRIDELWWGIDTFLFKGYRGSGIGKQLQKQLHDDLPNFTSAAYTPINGIIKEKCGGKAFFDKQEFYYGVSSYFMLLAAIFAHKKLKLDFSKRGVAFPFYSFFKHRNYAEYEIVDASINQSLVDFVNDTLKDQSDFFVWRSLDYMKWKYEQNPAFKYKLLQFRLKGKAEAILGFTDIHLYLLGGRSVRSVKILDAVIAKNSKLTHKDLLVFVANYFRQRHVTIDGIFSLIKCNWFPKISVSRPVLSTINEKVNKPYITFLDQDMEQVL